MKYNTALPYFFDEDIDDILPKIKKILKGDGLLTKGPKVKEFEKLFSQYVASKYCIAVNSGTSALEIVLKAIGINTSDEVIIPVQTFVSTGSCVTNNGGTPIFCEIDENYLMDFDDLKRKITAKTKAVIIVHYCGLIHPKILEIKAYLKERNIYFIEDAAHAHGAKIDDKFAGNIGDFGCFSFYSTKIMTTGGEGGAITLNNENYFNLCDSLGSIGIDKKSRNEIYTISGSNNRLTEIQAIIGINQLSRLESFVRHRNNVAQIYKNNLSDLEKKGYIKFQEFPASIRHPYWRFLVILDHSNIKRKKIKEKLAESNINIDWPYQPLIHLQPLFKKFNSRLLDLTKSEQKSKKHICLPVHLEISLEDAEFISEKFIECFPI